MKEEALAVRERVGLMDLSTFSKFDVKGKDAHAFLERICANKIPAKDGGIILGHLLNANGFIESEITVTRLAADHFYVLSAAVAQLHDFDQLTWRKRDDEQVTITDITDDYGVLVLAGPLARDVLGAMHLDRSLQRRLPLAHRQDRNRRRRRWRAPAARQLCRRTGLGTACAHGARCRKVFDALMAAGKPHGIRLFGTYAMNSLRMEKVLSRLGLGTHHRDRHDRSLDGALPPPRQG